MKQLLLILIVGMASAGCRSNSTQKAVLERGWIGGEYHATRRSLVPPGKSAAVYVKQVHPETPAASAGLQPADLILAADGHPIPSLRAFHRIIDETSPGRTVALQVLRNGEARDLQVTAGRETYRQWHALSFGLHASSRFDLWPNPDFTLLPLVKYRRPEKRVELRSPESMLERQASPGGSQGETGVRSEEGWNGWLLIFGFDAHKRILTQSQFRTVE